MAKEGNRPINRANRPQANATALLGVLFAAAFIAAFNENIVNVGLVDIMAEFNVNAPTAQWLVTGYMIVTTIVVSIVAWLQKRFSLRSLFFAASALILTGSLADLVTPTFALLLAFRLMQAIGTGIFVPAMMTTVLVLAPRAKLGSYLAIGSACITLGPALGPVASGAVITLFGWRAMFVLPAVAMLFIVVAGFFFVHPISDPVHEKIDVPSVALIAAGLTLVVYGLLVLTTHAVLALSLIALGIASLAVFAKRQARIDNPVLDLRPLHSVQFLLPCLLVIVCMMTTFSLSVLLPLYFEQAGGANAMQAGLMLLAPILVNAITALVAGRVFDKRGERPLLPIGYAVMALGLGLLCLLAGSLNMTVMIAAASVAYAAVGLVMSPTQTSGLRQLPDDQHASGVALMNTFIQLAASIGPSLFVGILSSTSAQLSSAGASPASASAAGLSSAVGVAGAVALLGFACSLAYLRLLRKARSSTPSASPSAIPLQKQVGSAAAASDDTHAMPAGTIRSLMKTDVFTVPDSASVADALKTLVDNKISGAPIVDETGAVSGFVSDGDIMRYLANQSPAFKSAWSFIAEAGNADFDETLLQVMALPVSEVATRKVVSIDLDSSLGEACRVLAESHLKKAPVTENGKMVGIINRSNISRYAVSSYFAA